MSRRLPQPKSTGRPLPQLSSQRTTGVTTRSKAGGATMTSHAGAGRGTTQKLYPDLGQVSKPGSSEPLDLILIGKSGNGKSALGNSILSKNAFQRNNKSSSVITLQDLKKESVDYKGRTIRVVDGLNVGECTSTDQGDVERDIKYLTNALKLCNNGFSALLIVIKFGVQFSDEEEEALNLVKAILGDKVLGLYGICVITFGDNYEHSLEEEEFKNFKEWCSQQPAALGHLIKECDNRCVIFNNRTKDAKEKTEQLDKLFQTITGLSKNGKRRYSEKDFESAKTRHGALLKARKPQDVERKTSMIVEEAREHLKEIEKAGESQDKKLVKMEKLAKELGDHKSLLEKTSDRSSVKAQASVTEITALLLDIESRIRNLRSVEGRMSGNYHQSHANVGHIGGDPLTGERPTTKSLEKSSEQFSGKHSMSTTIKDNFSHGETSVESSFGNFLEKEEYEKILSRIQQTEKKHTAATNEYVREIEEAMSSLDDLIQRLKRSTRSRELLPQVEDTKEKLKQKVKDMRNASSVSVSETQIKKLKLDDDARRPSQGASSKGRETSTSVFKGSGAVIDVGSAKGTQRAYEDRGGQDKARGATTIQKKSDKPVDPNNVSVLLIGLTGNGRSATANSILGKAAFKSTSSTTAKSASSTSSIGMDSVKIGEVSINVIDGPGINDSEDNKQEELENIVNNVEKSMELCDYEFSALLIVLKFGVRFTKQEVESIKVIKSALGKDVIKEYGICVVTHGDNFDYEAEEAKEAGETLTFEGWCNEQEGDVKKLFEECNFRVVLFDNKAKDDRKKQEQVQKLLDTIDRSKKYSKEEFLLAEEGMHELMFENMLPQLEQQVQSGVAKLEEKIAAIDKESWDKPEEYRMKMITMLEELQKHKAQMEDIVQASPLAGRIIVPLSLLEVKIRSKIDQNRIEAEQKRMESTRRDFDVRAAPSHSSHERSSGKWPTDPEMEKLQDETKQLLAYIQMETQQLNPGEATFYHDMSLLREMLVKHRKYVEEKGCGSAMVNKILVDIITVELEITDQMSNRQSYPSGASASAHLTYPYGQPSRSHSSYPKSSTQFEMIPDSAKKYPHCKDYTTQKSGVGNAIKKKWKKVKAALNVVKLLVVNSVQNFSNEKMLQN